MQTTSDICGSISNRQTYGLFDFSKEREFCRRYIWKFNG